MMKNIVRVIDLVPGGQQLLPIVRANDIGPHEFWNTFVRRSAPVILQDSAKSWPALQKWASRDYLQSRCNGEVVLMSQRFNSHPSSPYYKYASIQRSLNECLEEMYNAENYATYSIAGTAVPAGLKSDLGDYAYLMPKYLRRARGYPAMRLFIYRNASTDWHYHPFDETVTTQLLGSKHVSLFRLTSENWDDFSVPIKANLQHFQGGHTFFPEQKKIIKFEGILHPGDAVYIPPFWWHGIDPADSGVGMTLAHCFRSPLSRIGSWGEPAAGELFREIGNLRTNAVLKTALKLAAVTMISASTLKRKFSGEQW